MYQPLQLECSIRWTNGMESSDDYTANQRRAVHDVPCHEIRVKQFYTRIWCLHLGFPIRTDDDIALFVFFNHYIAKTLTQYSKPALKTTYHSREKAERPTMSKQNGKVNYIDDNNLMR